MNNDIGKRVREIRESLGFSQEKFGKRIGLVKSAVSRIESGANPLTDKNMILICRSFGVRKDWLLEGKGEMFEEEISAESIVAMLDIADPMDVEIISAYLRLDEKYRMAFRELFKELIGK